MPDERDLERRIRETAHRLWEEAGRPDNKADEHWEQARLLVAAEDGMASTLKPAEEPGAEPVAAVENLGEFPHAERDQGDRRPFPGPRPTKEDE